MDRDLAEFIDSMLAKNPDDRPANWGIIREKLLEIHLKLFPDAEKPGMAPYNQSKKSTPVSKVAIKSSWSAEKKEVKLLEKFPWLVPVLLILIILAALISIPITLGLFE